MLAGEGILPQVSECLRLCSLVEFAKHEACKEDFGRIMSLAKSIISSEHKCTKRR